MRSLLAVSLLLVSLVGCGTAPSTGPTVSPGAPAGEGAREGEECSDDVAVQKKCAVGLVCSPKPDAPVSEHTPGVCKKP